MWGELEMVFKVKETSYITRNGAVHREITDAMEAAINWLATQPVGTKQTITERITVERVA